MREGTELSDIQAADDADGTPPSEERQRVHPAVATLAAYSWRILVIGAVVVGAVRLFGELKVVLVPILIALLLSRVLDPLASRLRRAGWRPGLAAATVLLGFLAALAATASLLLPAVVDQFANLGPTLTRAVDDVETWLVEDAPVDISRADLESARDQVIDRVAELFRSPPGSLAGAAGLLVEIPTGGVLAAFLTFFMLKDGERFVGWVRRRTPAQRRELLTRGARRGWAALGGFLRGAAMLGTLEGVVIGATVHLVGGELVAPIMVLTFAAAFVPILGAIVAGLVAVLVTLVTAGFAPALIVAVVAIVVQQLDNDLLAPVIYGRMLQIHPAMILVGVVAGGAMFGFLGTIFAVPVLVVTVGVIDEVNRYLSTDGTPAATAVEARSGPPDGALGPAGRKENAE